jgi:hypothetical protein
VPKPILTILIPTRNRPLQLNATLLNLTRSLANLSAVEILVCDNSDSGLNEIYSDPRIRVVRPIEVLDTAEENLFFGIPHAEGTYIWPLGDDDVVLRSGLEKLLSECEIGRFDAFTMNTRNVTNEYQSMGWSRVICFEERLVLPYEQFLERVGYWSIPAGISLTVFKAELISEKSIDLVQNLRSRIYSHVTLLALVLKGKDFAFINTDLVEYRTNLHDTSHQTTDHWTSYSSKKNLNDRFFWLNGFIEHLKFLEENKAINPNYLSMALDIGHFNHRLPLLEHMLGMFIDQILIDIREDSIIPLSYDEASELLDYFEEKAPTLIGYFQFIRYNLSNKSSLRKKIQEMEELKSKWERERASYPFRRFYDGRIYGYFIYDTPLGWLALPQRSQGIVNGVPAVENLEGMLLGIDFPHVEGTFTGDTKEDLLMKVKENVLERVSLPELIKFQLVPVKAQMGNNLSNSQNLLKIIWSRLPLRLKIYLRNSILGR